MADVKRGQGPGQLPFGAATKLNETAATPPPGPNMAPQSPGAQLQQDIPVEYGTPQSVKSHDPSLSDNMQLLTGPSDPQFKPSPQGKGRVPAALVRALPLLAVAIKNPDAPFSLTALYRSGVAAVERENGEFD